MTEQHHKHHIHLLIVTYVLLAVASPLIWATGAHAQTSVACPAGYVCTPIQQVANCPAGFVCTPTSASNTTTYTNGYYYGNAPTTAAVPVTGMASAQPSTSACYTFGVNLGIGSTGGDVSALQKILNAKGYSVSVTGTFDYQTANAVSQYQASLGIPATGFVGSITRARLSADCSTGTGTSSNINPSKYVYWSNGNSNVQIGIVDSRFETNRTILGWVVLHGGPTGSVNWSKPFVTDLTGTVDLSSAVRSSVGPFRVIAVTNNSSGNLCVTSNSNCSYVLSQPFVLTDDQTISIILPGVQSSSNPSAQFGVLYPNGGESFTAGQAVTFSFNPANAYGQRIEIDLVNVDTRNEWVLGTVVGQATDKQAFSTTLSPTLPAGNYKIRAAGVSNSSPQDLSDSTFRINASAGNSGVSIPSITSISPNAGTGGTAVTVYGSNLSGASSVEFFNSAGQMVASLVPSYSSAQSVSFTISGVLAANMTPGAYQLGVVTNNCAGGCDSNRLSFTLTQPTPVVTAPLLSYAQAKAEVQNVLHAGEQATLYGSNLSGLKTISLGSYAVAVISAYDTSAVFAVPSTIPAGTYSLNAINGQNVWSSNIIQVNVAAAPAPVSGPTTSFSLSSNSIVLSPYVAASLTSTTVSPSGTLKSAAIDMSKDNVTWESGYPCGYWNSPTGADSSHVISCSFIPGTAGTYYFRSRGTDGIGASGFVYQTLVVTEQ